MKIALTDKGLQALAQNQIVQLLDFIAGDSKSLSVMEKYVAGQSVGSNIFYQYGIEESHTYIKGDTYTPSDGGKPYIVENTFLELRGTLNCLNVPASFMMRSMGIKAKIGENPPFVYAFGSISSSDKPYPVNSGEFISYITPVKIIYDNASDVTAEESGVPWKNFIQHTEESVTSENGAHGLKINPITKELTVGDTTVILSGGDERIAELEEEVQGVLKYSQREDSREYVSEWTVSDMEGEGTQLKPYKITNPYHITLIGTPSYGSGSAFYSLEVNLDLAPCTIGPNATWNRSGNIVIFNNVDDTAPCYNKGLGFPCQVLNGGTFNGNGHFIKGLIIGESIYEEIGQPGGVYETLPYSGSPYNLGSTEYARRRGSLFCMAINSSTICNLNIVSSVIIIGYKYRNGGSIGTSNFRASSFCNYMDSLSKIQNCSSTADLVAVQSNYIIGGICASVKNNSTISYCSFRGTISGVERETSSYVGSIAGEMDLYADRPKIIGCYSTVSISIGGFRGMPGAGFGRISGCYFAGYIAPTSSSNVDNIGSLLYQNNGTNKLTLKSYTADSFSLEGSCLPQRTQGSILSMEYMQSKNFVNDLNNILSADSENPVFVWKEGDFPRLWFEDGVISEDFNPPVAAINPANRKVLDSGYTVQTLSNFPTVQDLANTYRSLSTVMSAKSRVTAEEVSIPVSSWSGNRYRHYTDSVGSNQFLGNIILVPGSSDFFNYGIYANNVVYDNSHDPLWYIEFQCSTQPSSDISFKIIVIEGPALT